MTDDDVIIGLETHVQLNTNSKMFCSCPTKGNDVPNTRTCETCIGAPGSKPRLNEAVVNKALSIALALGCKINKRMTWDRKSYFYPDMGKNYQVTQYDTPIGFEGKLGKIRITRIHMEEDPARLVHVGGSITTSDHVMVDYNRSGIPLVEIVTEPDMKSPEEARDYLNVLISILEHLGVFESGDYTIKSDANISIKGGERVEVKNVSGIRNVELALRYELVRQRNMVRRGHKITRETRQFDPISTTTHALRSKETEMDYGYIVDPDLPWLIVDDKRVKEVRDLLPELPEGRIKRFVKDYSMNEEQARTIVGDKALADFYEACVKGYKKPSRVASWIDTQLLKCLNYNKQTIRTSKVTPSNFMELIQLMDDDVITERLGKELIKEFVSTGVSPKLIVSKKGLGLKSDDELVKIIKKVLKANPIEINDKSINYLIGQVIRETKGQADPNKVRQLIKKSA
ncbi:MAG: Asp-tRNA(Asn)/Glu-tRNA(Gln) amidotransferase subunit GatB [Candidatus Nanoarchaeia archaeon]|jgi:aspartyl-tRNA(Asn)/glutamyl-tRNA(Gln) amidotransferase subunit B